MKIKVISRDTRAFTFSLETSETGDRRDRLQIKLQINLGANWSCKTLAGLADLELIGGETGQTGKTGNKLQINLGATWNPEKNDCCF